MLLIGQSPAHAEASRSGGEDLAALGRLMFFDESLSANRTQSCATCHAAEVGFTGPDAATNRAGAVYEGAIPNHYGNRKPPTSAYAGDSPDLYQDSAGAWFGGMFWDGRAAGWTLHDPLAEQAQGPFLNPLEQAIANAQVLCGKVKKADYAGPFEQVWGTGSLDCARDAQGVYEKIGRSVAAFERSPEVNPFSSKFDLFWDHAQAVGKDVWLIRCGTGGGMGGGMGGAMGCPGGGTNGWASYRGLGLADSELQGLAVFNDSTRGDCASCHSLEPASEGYPLFTDFGYDNLGIPKNPDNPFYSMPAAYNPVGADWVDYGLGAFLNDPSQNGKFKVPTLRNVDQRPSEDFVKAYGHNGYFKSLEDIVLFYHWRAAMDSGMGGMGGGMGGHG